MSQEANEILLLNIIPRNFDGSDPKNAIEANRHSFSSLCTVLESKGCNNPKNLTVYEYYSKLQYYDTKK